MTLPAAEMDLRARLILQSQTLGFADLRVTSPQTERDELAQMRIWLERGFAGEMSYLERRPEIRFDAQQLLPECRSVIALAFPYYQSNERVNSSGSLQIARYAWGENYHHLVGQRLSTLGAWLDSQVGDGHFWKATCDTSPVSEKAFAIAAGLGWRGKHSLVLNQQLGSWFFIGLLLTSARLSTDSPVNALCGNCTRCIDACPTSAISEPGVLKAERCISYQTTARKSDLPTQSQLANWIFGCDVCQDVCPFNRYVPAINERAFDPKPGMLELTSQQVLDMSEAEFDALFAGTEIMRRGLERLKAAARCVQDNQRAPVD